MSSLRAQHLSFSFDDRVLLEDVSFHLAPGWTGVVGQNSAGKTTLLELLAGLRTPGSGQVVVEPRGAAVTLCPQRVESCESAVRAFAADESRDGHRLRALLEVEPEALDRWSTLSPGERKRWQLGAALVTRPDVLLLDEPLNHLDHGAAQVLSAALAGFRGVGVLVSHDRALLDAVTHATLRLVDGACEVWAGGFSAAREAWLREEDAARRAHEETRRRLDAQRRKVDDERRRLLASSRQRQASARMKGPQDSDARSVSADFRAEQAEKSHAGRLRQSTQQAARLERRLDALEVRHVDERALFLRDERCPRPVTASFAGEVQVGARVLLREVAVQVPRGAHVVLSGPNGSGKTTLLQHLLGACTLPPGRVLALPQELTLAEQEQDLGALRALEREARGRVLQLVDALGTDPEQLLRTARPSPGEGRKLRLALGLGRSAWLAVLDEPTNHLDLPSVERLEAALLAFPGALVVVTHDAALGDALAQVRWRLEGGRVLVDPLSAAAPDRS